MSEPRAPWPALPVDDWLDTLRTLHLWTQVVGKVQLALAPVLNHWWGGAMRVTPRGLTTGLLHHGERPLQITFDLLQHRLYVDAGAAGTRTLALAPRSVADFHDELMATLGELGTPVRIHTVPAEMEDVIPFPDDDEHASYDAAAVERFLRALLTAHRLLRGLRARFIGKSSPVHFFWGSFDLAVTFFSGREAPQHPGGFPNMPDWVTREAYSHEQYSAGWWPGHGRFGRASFFAYAYPEPAGFRDAAPGADAGFWSDEMSEFTLPWDDVRAARDPDAQARSFLQATARAAMERGGWDAGLMRGGAEMERLAERVRRTNRPA